MAESKFTPGPWSPSRSGITCETGFVAFTACNPWEVDETLADGESWLAMRERTKADRDALAEQVSANARLIAAAPELLAALEDAYCIFHPEEGEKPIAPKWMARAKSAIAKALGESA